jgi:hypothetical protein
MTTSTCTGCGAAIVWVVTEAGKRMPVDAKPEKRVVLDDVHPVGEGPRARVVDTYVSHFVTCPERDRFRRPKEGQQPTR